jgi:hypothetical protein
MSTQSNCNDTNRADAPPSEFFEEVRDASAIDDAAWLQAARRWRARLPALSGTMHVIGVARNDRRPGFQGWDPQDFVYVFKVELPANGQVSIRTVVQLMTREMKKAPSPREDGVCVYHRFYMLSASNPGLDGKELRPDSNMMARTWGLSHNDVVSVVSVYREPMPLNI